MAGWIAKQLWEVAVDQYGYVTSKDARRLGINVVELGKLSARRQIQKVGHGIYRFGQLPVTELDRYMLATLWANGRGVLSHETALDLYELCDLNPSKVHITVNGRHAPQRQDGEMYKVHLENIGLTDVTQFEGIPIVTERVAIEQCVRSGVAAKLISQALINGRERGAITKNEKRMLAALLAARR